MKRAFLLCVVLAAAPLSGKLLITGSSTMAPMVEELGKRFRARHPGESEPGKGSTFTLRLPVKER